MRVALITPWGDDVRGGLRTYSEYLLEGFHEASENPVIDVTRLSRYHNITGDYLAWLAEKALRHDPDVVHIQHEGGRYGNSEQALYDRLAESGAKIVTTVHSAQQMPDRQKQPIVRASDRIVVHNTHELDALTPIPGSEAVVIPHGCKLRDLPQKEKACVPLDIDPVPDTTVVTYGFLGPWKRVEDVIRAVHKLAGVTHVHVGEWHTDRPHGGYAGRMRRLAAQQIPHRHQWTGYVDDDDLHNAFGVADIAVYMNAWASESGSMAEMLGAGVPVIARDIPPYNDGRPVELVETDMTNRNADPVALENRLRELRDDGARRQALARRGREWAEGRSWQQVAEDHLALYHWALDSREVAQYTRGEALKWDATHHLVSDDDGRYDPLDDTSQIAGLTAAWVCQRVSAPALDVGCGDGRLYRYAQDHAGASEGAWTGIDISRAHVDAAVGVGYRALEQADAHDLPFDDGEFATVIMQNSIEHLPRQERALDEARRVLQPGGRLLVVTPPAERAQNERTDPFALSPEGLGELAATIGFETESLQLLKGADSTGTLKNRIVAAFREPDPDGDDQEGDDA